MLETKTESQELRGKEGAQDSATPTESQNEKELEQNSEHEKTEDIDEILNNAEQSLEQDSTPQLLGNADSFDTAAQEGVY